MSMALKRLAEAVEVIVINWIFGGFAAIVDSDTAAITLLQRRKRTPILAKV
jgi:hypothetical protein